MIPSLPLNAIWLDAKGIGTMLSYDERVVREKIACRPDFPQAGRIDGNGHPRWRADEVNAWMEAQRAKTGGRKRAA